MQVSNLSEWVCTLNGVLGKSVKSQNEEIVRALAGAEENEYPHQVRLSLADEAGTCGGSVYNKDWIITAAHCVQYGGKTTAIAGRDYVIAGLSYTRNATAANKFTIAEVIHHKEWDQHNIGKGHDIALLRLERSLPLEMGKIQPIRLAPADYIPPYGGQGLVMGWGNVDKTMDIGSPSLVEAIVPIHERSKTARLSMDPEGGTSTYTSIHHDQVGVGGDTSGFTVGQGDSGGPLICPDPNNKPMLCGVTSFKTCKAYTQCKRANYYVLISKYRDWIKEKTKGARQEKDMFVDRDLFPTLLPDKDVPDYLVRVAGKKTSCAGIITAPKSIVTNCRCFNENDGVVVIHHFATGNQYEVESGSDHKGYDGNISPALAKKGMRQLATNDIAMFTLKEAIDLPKMPLELPPRSYKVKDAVEYTMNEKKLGVERRSYVPMEKEECQHRVNLIDPNLKLEAQHTCMRQVYGADADCERDIGGLLVCEGKYICGMKNFHACKWSAFPEIFSSPYGRDLRAYYELFSKQ